MSDEILVALRRELDKCKTEKDATQFVARELMVLGTDDLKLLVEWTLATDQAVGRDPDIPKVDDKRTFKIGALFKGLDNTYSRLLKQLQPWLQAKAGSDLKKDLTFLSMKLNPNTSFPQLTFF